MIFLLEIRRAAFLLHWRNLETYVYLMRSQFIDPVGYHEVASPTLNCEPETSLLVLKQLHYDENDRVVLY